MVTRKEIRRGAGRSSYNSVRTSAVDAGQPWLCAGEWETVYNWLYSSKSALVEEGLGRVGAWRARGVVPLMVQLTADLCQCRLRERDRTDVQPLILQYSMAITRFINGVGEICKQKLGMRTDLTTCVHEYGVPSWVVTLRHMGTHQQLPSIGAMRLGAEFCLSWLRVNYWRPQRLLLSKHSGNRGSMSPDPRVEGLTVTTSPSSAGAKCSKDGRVESLTSGLCHTVKELETLLEQASYMELAEHLKRKQLLQFSSQNKFSLKELEALAKTGHAFGHMKLLCQQLIKTQQTPDFKTNKGSLRVKNKDTKKALEESRAAVPQEGDLDALPVLTVGEKEMKTWSKHLRNVTRISHSFKQRLLSALAVAVHQSEENGLLRDFLCGWLHYLLTTQQGVHVGKAGKVEVLQILEEEEEKEDILLPGEVDWQHLLHVLIQHPGHYSYPLVKIVCRRLRKSPIHGVLQDVLQMSRMVTVSSRIGHIFTSHYQEGKHTKRASEFMASVTEARSSQEDLTPGAATHEDSSGRGDRWEVVEDVEAWLQCPIGVCPGQTLGAHMLSILPQDRQLVIMEDCDSADDMEDKEDSEDDGGLSRQELQLTKQELQSLEQALLQLY